MSSKVLIVPGINNSGSGHWQTLWENANPTFKRVQQREWDNPVCEDWGAEIEKAVKDAGPNTIIVAHSLGTLALAHWAAKPHSPIKAALLVAVPDVNSPNFPKEARGFSPLPKQAFSFPSIVIASSNDPFGSAENAERCAIAWGSRIVHVGALGHINADSGLGDWQEGFRLLQQLLTL